MSRRRTLIVTVIGNIDRFGPLSVKKIRIRLTGKGASVPKLKGIKQAFKFIEKSLKKGYRLKTNEFNWIRVVARRLEFEDLTTILDYLAVKMALSFKRGRLKRAERVVLLAMQNMKCPCCKKDFLREIADEADHIVPIAGGGDNRPYNWQILCQDCNRRKSDK